MKNNVRIILLMSVIMLGLTACGINLKKKAPDDWYESTLSYYRQEIANDWKNAGDFYVPSEYTDKNNKIGYLLRDLDGDGTDEFLVGIIDGASETRFTDVYIWHPDIGPYRSFSNGDGYYIYLCDSNIIRNDSWYGSETRIDYMQYNSDNNSFLNVDGGSMPRKYDLTEF